MKVSVILPTFGRVSYLKNCLDSIENQTEKPYEVLVIGHQSDLDTKFFFENLQKKLNLKYIEIKGGSCKSRNIGIYNSSGDVLLFIDDDCILEEDYIKNLKSIISRDEIGVIAGYTFDIVDLTTPGLIKKKELEYIYDNREDKFFDIIIKEIFERTKGKINLYNNVPKIRLYVFIRYIRNFFKMIIIQEGIYKGKIISSGYRSEMPLITEIDGLKKVEWFGANNLAIKKYILQKYKFNEDMEILPYALGEDLELSARIGKEHDIFISSDLKLFHLRSPLGIRINQEERLKSMILLYYRVAYLRGNKLAYWWFVIGMIISRIFLLPLFYSKSVLELKGIFEGVKCLKKLDLTYG